MSFIYESRVKFGLCFKRVTVTDKQTQKRDEIYGYRRLGWDSEKEMRFMVTGAWGEGEENWMKAVKRYTLQL